MTTQNIQASVGFYNYTFGVIFLLFFIFIVSRGELQAWVNILLSPPVAPPQIGQTPAQNIGSSGKQPGGATGAQPSGTTPNTVSGAGTGPGTSTGVPSGAPAPSQPPTFWQQWFGVTPAH